MADKYYTHMKSGDSSGKLHDFIRFIMTEEINYLSVLLRN